jgi:hypothetical protein
MPGVTPTFESLLSATFTFNFCISHIISCIFLDYFGSLFGANFMVGFTISIIRSSRICLVLNIRL